MTYDATLNDEKGAEFAKEKPHKVLEAMKIFSHKRYHVDVLKVEVPVNMKFVEGFAEGQVVYSRQEALKLFKEQSEVTHLPYIYLSAGVSAQLFQETLDFAKEAGAEFNGVLCGRATWKDAVPVFASEGEQACRDWLESQGKANIEALNQVLARTATPWTKRLSVLD